MKKQLQFDLLITAIEGGSNYWYNFPDLTMIPKFGYQPKTEEAKKDLDIAGCASVRVWEAIHDGADIPVNDVEDPESEENLGILNLAAIEQGAKLMQEDEFSRHFADAISGDWDSITADVFFQLCLFGKIVFG